MTMPANTMPHMSRKQWGQIMRAQFTVEGFKLPCGHKIATALDKEGKLFLPTDPKTNCDVCWMAYFQNNGVVVQIADECFQEAGRDVLERSRGKKFVHYFVRFMSTMARFQREQEEAAKAAEEKNSVNKNNEQIDGSDGRGSLTTDSCEPGPTDETQEIGGLKSDSSMDSGGIETAIDGATDEGSGIGVGPVRQGLGDQTLFDPLG
jgi:hypothetical protein